MKLILVFVALLLTGCGGGIDWFPEQKASEGIDAGSFIASVRTGSSAFTVTTSKSAFETYTSLHVPRSTPVTLQTFELGKVLKALDKSILVKREVGL